jgi:hypothetical protein
MKNYRMMIEYWDFDENGNLFEERLIRSRLSPYKIANDYLNNDRSNLIRSVEVTPVL